jgi:hypothetical protein
LWASASLQWATAYLLLLKARQLSTPLYSLYCRWATGAVWDVIIGGDDYVKWSCVDGFILNYVMNNAKDKRNHLNLNT